MAKTQDRIGARGRRGPRLGAHRCHPGAGRGRHQTRHHRRHVDRRRGRRPATWPASSTLARELRPRADAPPSASATSISISPAPASSTASASATVLDQHLRRPQHRGPRARASRPSPPRSAPGTRSGCRAAASSTPCAPPTRCPASSAPSRSTAAGCSTARSSIPIPVSVCRALGARYVIAVNLNFDMCGRGTIVPHFESEAGRRAPRRSREPQPASSRRNGRAVTKLLQRQLFGRADNGARHLHA